MKRIFLSAALVISVLLLSVIPATASTNEADAASDADYRVPCGSFIQDYMTASWSDTRWQQELAAMKKAGMDMLIFSPSVVMGDDGQAAYTLYPSKIAEFSAGYVGQDRVDACLRNCEQAGVKVFVALNQDPSSQPGHFWQFGWKVSDTQPDVLTQYWQKNAEISNKLADELYSLYKSKYPDAFYGWYWVHEFWNYTILTNAYENKDPNADEYKDKVASDPKVYTDILANEALNPVLDHLTEIDPSMPMLFSSFKNPTLCTSSAYEKMWSDVFSVTRFRPGDIWAPMDGMGNDLSDFDTLDEWTAASKRAADVNSNLHFWINNELQVNYVNRTTGASDDNGGEIALLDRTVKQIAITAKYAEQNVFFTWNHFMSPYNVLPGYNETYMQYVTTGTMEKNPPSAVDVSKIRVLKVYDSTYYVSWKEPRDDVGVAEYKIYKDNQLIKLLHGKRIDYGGTVTVPTSLSLEEGEYEIEALDFAGNASPRVKFTVNEAATTATQPSSSTTESTDTTITEETTESTAPSVQGPETTEPAGTTELLPSGNGSDTTAAVTDSTAAADSEENPKTGSSLPGAVAAVTIVSVGLALSAKAKHKK